MAEHGYTPLGKFDCARDDILHYLCTSDWANDSFGNVGDYGSYVWKISNTPEEVSLNNGEFTSLMGDWFLSNPEVTDSPELRSELVGHFIVTTTDSGFVYVEAFDLEQVRDLTYSKAEEAYGEWDGDENGDDGHEGPNRIQEENDYKFGDDRL